jgi:hypothetical protein
VAQSRSKGPDPAVRRRTIRGAKASPHLAALSLPDLRAYRQRLTAEEERASYWRRLVHARLDLIEAESHVEGTLSMDELVRVLGDTGSGHMRNVLLTVRPADPLPELPVLAEMWDNEVDPHDPVEVEAAQERLRAAETKLTAYRRALHERIDEATAELIVRYRENPTAALESLPEV